jgi:hypothetical protein
MRSLLITLLLTLPLISMMDSVDENPFESNYTADDEFYSISIDDQDDQNNNDINIDQSYNKHCAEFDTEYTEEE